MQFLDRPTRNLFFTGKGGVGKTSVACATAVRLADSSKRVLLVSTDPASNLDEVLGIGLSSHATAIPGVPGMFALNLDPEAAAAAYRERMVGPYRGLLPAAAIASMEEQFSGSCTLEIAAFDEFSRLLGDATATPQYDHVIFDTAPTGHTLRLLTLPSAWTDFMETNTTGTSCLGPLAGLREQQRLYQNTVQALAAPETTTLVLVSRPEPAALREAARTSGELAALGVANQHLVINGVFQAVDPRDRLASAMQQRGERALAALPESLRHLPQTIVPLQAAALLGIDALRSLNGGSIAAAASDLAQPLDTFPGSFSEMIDDLAAVDHGVILTMGKGGVGKTTIAAALAVELARRGLRVHLSTTDPAAHIAATVEAADELPGLSIGRIDPAVETAAYSAEVMSHAGADLDSPGRALLAEDLRSPCTEEIAVFRAFAQAVADGNDRVVVLDTAPTGHTILLLDAALAYHREVTRQTMTMPPAVEQLLPRLRDPLFTRIVLVTLPEATPVHEAAQLQRDLRRAQIEPYGWVINQSLTPLNVDDPLLKERQRRESRYLHEVITEHARRTALVPWQESPPVGAQGLRALVESRESISPQHS
jgi:arsenite-transporting ATPase